MDRREVLAVIGGAVVGAEAVAAPAPADTPARMVARRNQWVSECLQQIKSIRPGMTRKALGRLFKPAGGRYSRTLRSYSYRPCPYFKISVTFQPADGGDREQPGDKIIKVSTPYLDDPLAE
jgi:hypothetical protein